MAYDLLATIELLEEAGNFHSAQALRTFYQRLGAMDLQNVSFDAGGPAARCQDVSAPEGE